jgi:uncharacterized membrane protein SpoIIM required for sporulation
VRLIVGCVPLLIVAGFIEGFVSPSNVPAAFKVGVGLSSGLLLYTYWFKAGKRTLD